MGGCTVTQQLALGALVVRGGRFQQGMHMPILPWHAARRPPRLAVRMRCAAQRVFRHAGGGPAPEALCARPSCVVNNLLACKVG